MLFVLTLCRATSGFSSSMRSKSFMWGPALTLRVCHLHYVSLAPELCPGCPCHLLCTAHVLSLYRMLFAYFTPSQKQKIADVSAIGVEVLHVGTLPCSCLVADIQPSDQESCAWLWTQIHLSWDHLTYPFHEAAQSRAKMQTHIPDRPHSKYSVNTVPESLVSRWMVVT